MSDIPPGLGEPTAWWAETGTAGEHEGCNRPFWLREDARAYVQRHGGHIAPLFRAGAHETDLRKLAEALLGPGVAFENRIPREDRGA